MPKPPKPKGYCYARLDDSSHVYRQQGSSSLESSCYRMLQSPATTFYATASWNGGPGTNLSSEHSANEEWGPSEPRQPALFSRPAVLGDLTLAGGRLHHVAPEALHVDASLAHRVVASPTQPYRPRYHSLERPAEWAHLYGLQVLPRTGNVKWCLMPILRQRADARGIYRTSDASAHLGMSASIVHIDRGLNHERLCPS